MPDNILGFVVRQQNYNIECWFSGMIYQKKLKFAHYVEEDKRSVRTR